MVSQTNDGFNSGRGPSSNKHPEQRQRSGIEAFVRQLTEPGQNVEVRILGVDDRHNRTDSGYFDDPTALARAVAPEYNDRATGVYMTLNPVNAHLLARAANRIKSWAKHTTADSDIIRRRWLPIDVDPIRPSGISSSDEEHDAALDTARQIEEWLEDQGWPAPILADSGNGAHLLYAIDELNDPETQVLIQQCLEAIAFKWDDDMISVDTGNHNAARIWKLYGTKARKGDYTAERPHRWAYIVASPVDLMRVARKQLLSLAESTPVEPPAASVRRAFGETLFDVEAWMQRHNLTGLKKRWKDGWIWRLDDCPFSQDHSDGAFIAQLGNGALSAGCQHNRCRHKTWHDLRAMFEDRVPARPPDEQQQHRQSAPEAEEEADKEPISIVELLNLDSGNVPPLPPGVDWDLELAAGASPWLDEYVRFSRMWSPRAHYDFHPSLAVWLLSTTAARRVVLDLGGERFTNLYIALIARTSIYAKSTTANIAMDVLKRAGLDYLLAPDDATPQAFIRDLTYEMPFNWTDLPSEQQSQVRKQLAFAGQKGWFFDEFGQKVSAMMRAGGFMADFRGLLRKFDDCPDKYEYRSVNRGGDLVLRPYLALLANLTPADLQPYAHRHAALWNDGFWARFAFVSPPQDAKRNGGYFPVGERIIPEQLVAPLRQWHQRLGVPEVDITRTSGGDDDPTGRYVVTPAPFEPQRCELGADVREAANTYNDALLDIVRESRNQDLDGNYARLAEKAMRVAMLLASMENEDRIEIRHWVRAQQIAEMWRRNLHDLYSQVPRAAGESKTRSFEETILRLLPKKGPLTMREIYQNVYGLDTNQASIILKGMMEADLIVPVEGGSHRTFRPGCPMKV